MQDEMLTELYKDWSAQAERKERIRIIGLIAPHLDVCNYRAVTNEPCDVCHWVTETITLINGGKK